MRHMKFNLVISISIKYNICFKSKEKLFKELILSVKIITFWLFLLAFLSVIILSHPHRSLWWEDYHFKYFLLSLSLQHFENMGILIWWMMYICLKFKLNIFHIENSQLIWIDHFLLLRGYPLLSPLLH